MNKTKLERPKFEVGEYSASEEAHKSGANFKNLSDYKLFFTIAPSAGFNSC